MKWSKEDVQILTEYYRVDSSLFSVKQIALVLGRSEDAITLKAGKLGLTNANRRKSAATKERMAESQVRHFSNPENRARLSRQVKASINENGHPRGMLGKRHSEKTKLTLAAKSREAAKNRSDEDDKKRIMKGLKTRATNGTLAPPRNKTTWKAGWREIGGYKKYYRSRWEANYARYLEWLKSLGKIKSWLHEPDTFWFESIKRGCRSYLPDFKVEENNGDVVYHEVKGWMDSRSKTKLARMKKFHPGVSLMVIGPKQYKSIKSKVGGIIKGWE